jgi:uncharacterized iron-regulated protein
MTRRLLPCLALLLAATTARADDTIFRLALGDAARKGRELPVVVDTITDAARGDAVTPAEFAARLAPVRLLLVGESHTSVESHRVELQVLRALHAAGRHVIVGLEMYPYTEQRWLDAWNAGQLTEQAFVEQSRWYLNWGYHWNYYRDIFAFCREARIPMHAVNTPREVVSAVRKKGFQNLTPEEASHIPTVVDVDSDEYLAFFTASMNNGGRVHPGMTPDAMKGMLAAQATWDATMGWNAVEALKRANDPAAIMVVLVGSGHVAYGLGIARQARHWFDGPIATASSVPSTDEKGAAIGGVRASFVDYLFGVPGEKDSAYPTLGISLVPSPRGGRGILDVETDSSAARAGLQVGDLVTTLDGQPLTDMQQYNTVMAAKLWGDMVTVGVSRGGEAMTVPVRLTRAPATAPAK